MNFKLQSPSGKLDIEIFKEKEKGYYDYKITNHGNNITCFIHSQPLENVYEVAEKLDTIVFAQWNKSEPVENVIKTENDIKTENNIEIEENKKNKGRRSSLSEEIIEDIIQSFMDGESPSKLAEKYKISGSRVRYFLDHDERTRDLRLSRCLNKKQEEEIFELNNLGFNKEEIASEVQCSWIDVLYHLKNPKFLSEEEVKKYREETK